MTTGCHLEAPQVDEQGVGSQASSPGYPPQHGAGALGGADPTLGSLTPSKCRDKAGHDVMAVGVMAGPPGEEWGEGQSAARCG